MVDRLKHVDDYRNTRRYRGLYKLMQDNQEQLYSWERFFRKHHPTSYSRFIFNALREYPKIIHIPRLVLELQAAIDELIAEATTDEEILLLLYFQKLLPALQATLKNVALDTFNAGLNFFHLCVGASSKYDRVQNPRGSYIFLGQTLEAALLTNDDDVFRVVAEEAHSIMKKESGDFTESYREKLADALAELDVLVLLHHT